MNVVLAAGIALTTVGVAGYLVGLGVSYPGRAFSVTAVMIGITLVAIGRGGDGVDCHGGGDGGSVIGDGDADAGGESA